MSYDRQVIAYKNYFLDFYFPEFNLDLEIDGKQHEYPERKESDKLRDTALTSNGYKVYRVKWKSLNTKEGKIFIKEEIEKFLKFMPLFGKLVNCILLV